MSYTRAPIEFLGFIPLFIGLFGTFSGTQCFLSQPLVGVSVQKNVPNMCQFFSTAVECVTDAHNSIKFGCRQAHKAIRSSTYFQEAQTSTPVSYPWLLQVALAFSAKGLRCRFPAVLADSHLTLSLRIISFDYLTSIPCFSGSDGSA